MIYQESLDWLYGLQVHGIQLGLENMKRLCAALGIETECEEKRKFIHVAGTNGKGSVCAMLAAILCAEGKRTGLYTSPQGSTPATSVRWNSKNVWKRKVSFSATKCS